MNNQEQFEEFLRCCKEQRVKRMQLAEPALFANPAAADFGAILIEFEHSNYLVTAKYRLHPSESDGLDEFRVKKYEHMDDLKEDDLTEADIYMTLAEHAAPITFITEMIDEYGRFNGMEWKYTDGYLFLLVSCPIIIVSAAYDEGLKYLLYPHQFSIESDLLEYNDAHPVLFPEG